MKASPIDRVVPYDLLTFSAIPSIRRSKNKRSKAVCYRRI